MRIAACNAVVRIAFRLDFKIKEKVIIYFYWILHLYAKYVPIYLCCSQCFLSNSCHFGFCLMFFVRIAVSVIVNRAWRSRWRGVDERKTEIRSFNVVPFLSHFRALRGHLESDRLCLIQFQWLLFGWRQLINVMVWCAAGDVSEWNIG